MSAPDTNLDKQKRRHRPSLIGIWAALAFGAIIALLLVFNVFGDAEEELNVGTASETIAPQSAETGQGSEATTTETTGTAAEGTDGN
ncbi:hypothetical protein R5H30_05770 [Sulfitobacter sp. D35]|uniref:hypothetical protein n=1 Tax=Sulfitobacter sp. D35 TaxID=3083252 RepID=UPI00296E2968|nr:hypothetical protein [Sulfitobacter sp. D35]MDW4497481.1 hypothetical protein [Sulfitobacter sp. D35]